MERVYLFKRGHCTSRASHDRAEAPRSPPPSRMRSGSVLICVIAVKPSQPQMALRARPSLRAVLAFFACFHDQRHGLRDLPR